MIKNKKIKKNWGEEDVKILIWLISKYADINLYSDVERDLVKHFLSIVPSRLVIFVHFDTWCHALIVHVQMAEP